MKDSCKILATKFKKKGTFSCKIASTGLCITNVVYITFNYTLLCSCTHTASFTKHYTEQNAVLKPDTVFPQLLSLRYYYKYLYLQLNSATLFKGALLLYFHTYKQLYVISFLFFDNLVIVSRKTLLFTASDNITR